MKKKLRFIMPRLIGATVIAGLAALIITAIFKLLLGLVVLGAVISLVSNKMSRRRNQLQAQYNNGAMPGLAKGQAYAGNNGWTNQPQPAYAPQNTTGIIPIN